MADKSPTTPKDKAAQDKKRQDDNADEESNRNYGGRDQSPDTDVNPAKHIHIDDGETADAAKTRHHGAQQRVDKSDEKKKPKK